MVVEKRAGENKFLETEVNNSLVSNRTEVDIGPSGVPALPLGVAGGTKWPLYLVLFFLLLFFLCHILLSQKGLS